MKNVERLLLLTTSNAALVAFFYELAARIGSKIGESPQ
jgi:hypothetical protein